MKRMILASASLLAVVSAAAAADAQTIYTATKGGAYDALCGALKQQIARNPYLFEATCTESAGTPDNIKKVLADPKAAALGQGDVYALMRQSPDFGPQMEQKLAIARDDVASECLYMITNNENVISLSDLSNAATRIPFILPPKDSGSAASFTLLQQIDANGLGKATNVSYVTNTDDMIDKVLATHNAVGLFVQVPDPSNGRFKKVSDQKGHFISVLNRAVITYQIGGQQVYKGVETKIHGVSAQHPDGGPLTTACTPILIFTGKPDLFAEGSADRKNQEDLIKAIASADKTKLVPPEPKAGFLATSWKWMQQSYNFVSAEAADKYNEYSPTVREKIKALTH